MSLRKVGGQAASPPGPFDRWSHRSHQVEYAEKSIQYDTPTSPVDFHHLRSNSIHLILYKPPPRVGEHGLESDILFAL